MKIIYLLLTLVIVAFGQNRNFNNRIFTATQDTISSTTAQDTLDWRVSASHTSAPAWIPVTDYISAAEKAAGVTLPYILSGEADWTQADNLQLRIRSSADTITSGNFNIGSYNGAITAWITPDTSASVTYYGGSRVTGN